MARIAQGPGEMSADEASAAGNQDEHANQSNGVVRGSDPPAQASWEPRHGDTPSCSRLACRSGLIDGTMRSSSDVSRPDALKHALLAGSSASVLSALVLSLGSGIEEGSAAGALNGPSQWLWGEQEAYTRRATLRHTLVGYAIHHASSLLWGGFYGRCFGRGHEKPVARVLAEAALTTMAAYSVDYYVTPKRFRPGFRKHLGPGAIFASYAAFAAGLALATICRRDPALSDAAGRSSRAR
jgi:hypothetical protein